MAQTEHLGLHQWEATDSFLRTDFNEDFQKIDGAVEELKHARVTGSYTMAPSGPLNVEVGFRPSLLLVWASAANGPGLAVLTEGLSLEVHHESYTNRTFLSGCDITLTDTGFQVDASDTYFNFTAGSVARYVAFQ